MVVKVLVVLSLVAMASASPAPHPKPTTDVGGGVSGEVSVSVSVGVIFKGIFGTIARVKKLVGGILDALLHISIRSLKDVFELIVNLLLVIEVILNNLVYGLGTLCVRLVACIIKIAVCVKGCPGDRGICTKAWNQRFKIDADASTAIDMITIFNLKDVQKQYDGYVSKCTGGKGISSLPKNSIRIVLEKISIFIKIILDFNTISKNTVTDCYVHLIAISVAIGNSKKRDSGKQITREILPRCSKYFKQEGYTEIIIYINIIEKECQYANNDGCDWDGDNPVTTSKPPVTTSKPPVTTSKPPVTTSKPPVTTSKPPVHTTPKPVITTAATTKKPVTYPPATTTRAPVTVTSPPDDHDDDCGPIIGGAIKVIPGCTKLGTTTIIKEIINIKIRTMTDVINLCVKVTICLGGILDLIITGLGSIWIRMVAVIFKVGCCGHGWGDRSICTKEYNSLVGVSGDATEITDMYSLYRLHDCKRDFNAIINKYTGGKDISKRTDVISVILQRILVIVNIIDSRKITKEHFSICFINVITIFGSIVNSYSKDTGTKIVQKVIPICAPHFVRQGCPDIRKERTKIVTIISVGNKATIDWKSIETKYNSGDVTTYVKYVFKHVKRPKNTVSLNVVFTLSSPRSIDGCISMILKILRALGSILNVYVKGLGSLIVRIVGCLIHYIIAILGKSRHSRSFVCQKAYFDSFGVKVVRSTWVDLVAGFNLGNCKAEYDGIVAAYKGKANRVIKLILDCTGSLVAIVSKGTKIVASDLTELFRYFFTIFAAFANSCKPNLGKKICDAVVPVCSSYLEKHSYPALVTYQTTIVKSIEVCNNVQVGWVTTVVEN